MQIQNPNILFWINHQAFGETKPLFLELIKKMHRMGKKQSMILLKKRCVTQTVPDSQEVDKILIQLPHLLSNFAG